MARAGADALRTLLPLLRQLREIKGLKETQPGTFYARRDAFIQFHDEGGVLRPISTSCADHMGSTWARIQTWDGTKWSMTSDFMQADEQIIKPMVKTAADKYMSDKKLTPRTSADCQT